MKVPAMTRTFGLTAALLSATALGATVVGPVLMPDADARPITIAPPQGAPYSFADLVDRVSPAVVSVNVISETEVDVPEGMEDFFEFFRNRPGFEDYFRDREEGEEGEGPTRESRSLGSGFFISADGLIVTNNHVIRDATEIEIVMDDGSEYEAELVGADERTDLAVLRVKDGSGFQYVEFDTDTDLRRGDWVVALGNPFGFGGTATAGIVSADGRQLTGGGAYTDFLQIDASINRGNSGGPTFDLEGRVVGVNTAIVSPTGGSVGIGFAIPADLAKSITDQLIQDGKVRRGWLGVSIQNFTPEMAEALGREGESGALVAQVVVDSPAAAAGFQRNDVILKINGREMEDSTQVTRTVGNLPVGTEHDFTILRRGDLQVLKVTLGELPDDVTDLPTDDGGYSSSEGEDNSDSKELLGMSLSPLTGSDRRRLGLESDVAGLVLGSVEQGSGAARIGLRTGHAILEANFEPISTVDQLEALIEEARSEGRESILVSVRLNRQTSVVPLSIVEDE